MIFKRQLDLQEILKRKSTFLFGPRSTGKTSLYEHNLKPNRVYDLLNASILRRLTSQPNLIFEECIHSNELIIIDEVQKVPHLLDEVHRTIEKKKARFLLTGSSARKLKRNNANLLGGRATQCELLPLTSQEIPNFNLISYLNSGGIPRHYLINLEHPEYLAAELEDYVSLYLKEEIIGEAAVRNVEPFTRFLEIIALHNGDELSIEAFSSDCGVKASTFRNYLQILEDTLIGFQVPAFKLTKKRKAISRSKFFLFDVGVVNQLVNRAKITPKSEIFGKAFEHFIGLEVRAYLKYKRSQVNLQYWRSTSQFEVDFILGTELALEVKSTDRVTDRHLKGLRALQEEKCIKSFAIVSLDVHRRIIDGIEIIPWKDFLTELWQGRWKV